jgi:tetratricopeptide (TPR) repeat protein
MTDSRLEFNLILASYGSQRFQECLGLCRDYLAGHDSVPIYILAIRLCLNHLQLPQMALHFAKLGLERFPKNQELAFGEAVALSVLGDRSVYDTERRTYWTMAEEILRDLRLHWRDSAWHLACVQGHLGKFREAYDTLLPVLLQSKEDKHFALVALLKQAVEDYDSALHVLRKGLAYHPSSALLMAVRVTVKTAMLREALAEASEVSQSIVDFIRAVSQEGLEGSLHSNRAVQIAGLPSIKEETSFQSSQESLETIKLLSLDVGSATVQEALIVAFEACMEIEEVEMGEWLAARIRVSGLPKAVRTT